MDDLAEELGISKKTLYAHFGSKTDLLKAVIRAKFDAIEADLREVVSIRGVDFSIRLQQLLECLQRHLKELQPAFVRDMQREPEIFPWVQALRRQHIQRYFGKLFDDGRRAGVIRKDIPTGIAIEILLGVINAVINPQKLEELEVTPKEAFPMVVSVVLQGILTEKGRTQS